MTRFLLMVASILLAMNGCTKRSEEPAKKGKTATAPASRQMEILGAKTLAEATSVGSRRWEDTKDWPEEPTYLVQWMNKQTKLHIDDLREIEKTTAGLVFKDVDAQRGKVICLERAQIVQLSKGQKWVHARPYYTGLLWKGRDDYYSVYVAKDTGALVEKKRAGFCGVVTGTYTFGNTSGGATISIFLVGMFDLPSNRRPKQP